MHQLDKLLLGEQLVQQGWKLQGLCIHMRCCLTVLAALAPPRTPSTALGTS